MSETTTTEATVTVKTPKFLSRLPKKQLAVTATLVVATVLVGKYLKDRGVIDADLTQD